MKTLNFAITKVTYSCMTGTFALQVDKLGAVVTLFGNCYYVIVWGRQIV